MSVTRPTVRTTTTEAAPYAAYSTIRKGFPVKIQDATTTPKTVQEAAAITDDIIGIARDAGDATGAAGLKQIGVYLHGGIVPVLVGTGGATAGKQARLAVPSSADGVCDVTAVGGGTGKVTMLGIFENTGVAADYVGLRLQISPAVGS
jgi:hypothetical protein